MTAILKVDLPASCVTEYWCKITRQQIIPAGFFYSRRAKKGTYDLDNDDGSPYERCLRGIYAGRFYDGGGRGATGSYIELISESLGWRATFLDRPLLYGECYCWDRRKPLVGKTF